MRRLFLAAILIMAAGCSAGDRSESPDQEKDIAREKQLEEMIEQEDNTVPHTGTEAASDVAEEKYQDIARETTESLRAQQAKTESYFGE